MYAVSYPQLNKKIINEGKKMCYNILIRDFSQIAKPYLIF